MKTLLGLGIICVSILILLLSFVYALPPLAVCCASSTDCVFYGTCHSSGTFRISLDDDSDQDYCSNNQWSDCNGVLGSPTGCMPGELCGTDYDCHEADTDPAFCAALGNLWYTGNYEVGTPSCCGDDSNEFYNSRRVRTDATWTNNPSDNACCSASTDCVINGQCVPSGFTSGSTSGTIPDKHLCWMGQWWGGDTQANICDVIPGTQRWGLGGEVDPAACCGDDTVAGFLVESKETRAAGVDSTFGTDPTDTACCDIGFDCVYQDTCVASGTTHGTLPDKEYCSGSKWYGGDTSLGLCNIIVGSGFWNLGGEVSQTTCCGDDPNQFKQQYIEEDNLYDTYACCAQSNDCISSDGTTCYGHAQLTQSNQLYCAGPQWLVCSEARECLSAGFYKCQYDHNFPPGWKWNSGLITEQCTDGWDNDCDGDVDCSDSDCIGLPSCGEICDNGKDDDGNGLIDFCDPACNCPSWTTQFGCTACASCTRTPTYGLTGTWFTFTFNIIEGSISAQGQFLSGDGQSTSPTFIVDGWQKQFQYPLTGTFIASVRQFPVGSEVFCPAHSVQPACTPVHGGDIRGCFPYGEVELLLGKNENTHWDFSYYCNAEGTERCKVCDVGYTYDSSYGRCVVDPCTSTGDGCSSDVSEWEIVAAPFGFCPVQIDTCVSCTDGSDWDIWCNDCYETCPDPSVNNLFSGCTKTPPTPAYSRKVSGDNSCITGDPVYACDNSGFQIGGNNVCYQCNSGFTYNTGDQDCCRQNGASGGTCSTDAECCGGSYCSQNDGDGNPIPAGQYACCDVGKWWHPGFGQCFPYTFCYPAPCIFLPINHPGYQSTWWGEADCIDQAQACCYTDISGNWNYNYLWNEVY